MLVYDWKCPPSSELLIMPNQTVIIVFHMLRLHVLLWNNGYFELNDFKRAFKERNTFLDLRAESCPLDTGFPEDISLDANLKGHKGMVHAAR